MDQEISILLQKVKLINDLTVRQMALGSIIAKMFTDRGFDPPVLAGGMAVSTYTSGLYGTRDLDLLSRSPLVGDIVGEIGYKKEGKDYHNSELNSLVEFPSISVDWDEKLVRKLIVEETGLPLYIIGVEDLILDRVSSYSIGSQGCGDWAMRLMGIFYPSIDWSYVHKTAHKLGIAKETEKLQRTVKYIRRTRDETSAGLIVDIPVDSTKRMKLF